MKRHSGKFSTFIVAIIVIALLCGTGWFAAQAYMTRSLKTGRALYEKGDYSAALASFQKADKFSLRPNADVTRGLADSYLALSDFDNAKKSFEKLVKLEPRNARALYALGLLAIRAKNYDDAEKQITALRELGGDEGTKYADALRSKMEVGKVKGFFQDLIKKVVPSLPSIPGLTDEEPVNPDLQSGDAKEGQN